MLEGNETKFEILNEEKNIVQCLSCVGRKLMCSTNKEEGAKIALFFLGDCD